MESANVVGFQNKATPNSGWTWMAATFEKVDGTTIKLKDFTPVETLAVTDFKVSLLDTKGATLVDDTTKLPCTFKYVNPAKYDPNTYKCGWYFYDAKTADMKIATFNKDMFANDYEVPYGTGIGVNRTSKSVTLVFSGAVAGEDKDIETKNSGWTWTGNVMPTDLKLSDITPIETLAVTDFKVSLLDTKGATLVDETTKLPCTFKYVNPAKYDPNTYKCGWYFYDAKTADMKIATFNEAMFANDYPIPAGQGFGINRTSKSVTLVIPSPLVDHKAAE